jgi:hypothetical protein
MYQALSILFNSVSYSAISTSGFLKFGKSSTNYFNSYLFNWAKSVSWENAVSSIKFSNWLTPVLSSCEVSLDCNLVYNYFNNSLVVLASILVAKRKAQAIAIIDFIFW